MRRLDDRPITLVCLETGSVTRCSRRTSKIVRKMEALPEAERTQFMKLLRALNEDRWPHDLAQVRTWTREQYRAAVDALP